MEQPTVTEKGSEGRWVNSDWLERWRKGERKGTGGAPEARAMASPVALAVSALAKPLGVPLSRP